MIDSASGAKLVLQVPPSARAGPVLDTVVTPTSVAIAAADGSVTVFQVPSKWDKDDPPCEMILHIAPDPEDLSDDDENEEQSGIGPVKQVEWVRKDGSDWLAIGGAGGVVVIKPSAYRGIVNIPMADVVKSNKVLKTDGVSNHSRPPCES